MYLPFILNFREELVKEDDQRKLHQLPKKLMNLNKKFYHICPLLDFDNPSTFFIIMFERNVY